MDLYWKNIHIPFGASLQVVEAGGDGFPRIWKILEIREKEEGEEYYDPHVKKGYSLRKVMKSRRLSNKSRDGELVHIPPCTYFLVIKEKLRNSGAESAVIRCFNVDFLSTLLDVRVL